VSLITAVGKGFTLGLVAFFALPMAGRAFPWEYAKKLTGPYFTMGMNTLGRALLIRRQHGGLMLKKTSYDATVGGEKARISGNVKEWTDPDNMMSRWRGRPFGLAHEASNTIMDARTLAIARRFRELRRRGEWEVDGRFKAFFHLDEAGPTELVDIADGLSVVQHSEAPGLVSRLKEFTRKSQMMFNQPRLMQHSTWLIALAVGFGLMFFANRLGDKASGSSSTVPLDVTAVPAGSVGPVLDLLGVIL
jgi:hypothetical protein